MTYATYVDGSWRCYRRVNGKYRQFLGCTHSMPRAAIAHTADIYASPLRASGSGPTRVTEGPPPPVNVGPPPESPRDSGLLGQAR